LRVDNHSGGAFRPLGAQIICLGVSTTFSDWRNARRSYLVGPNSECRH